MGGEGGINALFVEMNGDGILERLKISPVLAKGGAEQSGAVKKSTIIFFARLGSDSNRVHPARLSYFELSPLFPGFNEGFPRCYPHPINLLSRAITNNSKKEDL